MSRQWKQRYVHGFTAPAGNSTALRPGVDVWAKDRRHRFSLTDNPGVLQRLVAAAR